MEDRAQGPNSLSGSRLASARVRNSIGLSCHGCRFHRIDELSAPFCFVLGSKRWQWCAEEGTVCLAVDVAALWPVIWVEACRGVVWNMTNLVGSNGKSELEAGLGGEQREPVIQTAANGSGASMTRCQEVQANGGKHPRVQVLISRTVVSGERASKWMSAGHQRGPVSLPGCHCSPTRGAGAGGASGEPKWLASTTRAICCVGCGRASFVVLVSFVLAFALHFALAYFGSGLPRLGKVGGRPTAVLMSSPLFMFLFGVACSGFRPQGLTFLELRSVNHAALHCSS